MIECDFKVKVLKESVHSGDAGGIVPETFRIVRALLDRVDDSKTGKVVDAFQVDVSEKRMAKIRDAAKLLGETVYNHFPFVPGAKPMAEAKTSQEAVAELILNNSWRASMAITGAEGLPLLKDAGNVLRSETAIRISLRLPPNLDPVKAKDVMTKLLTTDVPHGAKVEIIKMATGDGLCAPDLTPALEKTVTEASNHFYGCPPVYKGEGGSIPFLASLAKEYPKAQFLITGVLGPESNAHGANEMLELAYTKKIICCLSYILAEFHKHK